MLSDRFLISDGQWDLIEPHCLGKKSDPGRTGGDARLFVDRPDRCAMAGLAG